MSEKNPIEILLVEDNLGDIELTQIAFSDSNIPHRIHVAHDGIEALDFLKKKGSFTHAIRPDVILLDLNMPRMDGKELLNIIKNDPEFRTIPIVIFSSLEIEKETMLTYKLQASCHIKKPDDLKRFLEVAKAVENFWLSVAKLPEQHKTPSTSLTG